MHTHIYEGFRSHGAARLSSGEARAQEAIRRAQQEQAAISPFFWRGFWMMNGSMISPAKLH